MNRCIEYKNMKVIKKEAPKCLKCWFPQYDDKKRMLVSFRNPETGKLNYGIVCPDVITPFGKGCTTVIEPEIYKKIILK